MPIATPTISLNYGQPFVVQFTCNLAINWEVMRVRTASGTATWTGTTTLPNPVPSQSMPPATFQAGDVLAWGADVMAPPGAGSSAYTLTVDVLQGGTKVASMTHSGTVAAADVQTETGKWACI